MNIYKAYSEANPKQSEGGFLTQLFPGPECQSVLHLSENPVPATFSHLMTGDLQTAIRALQYHQARRQNGIMVTANPSVKKRKGEKPLRLGDELCMLMRMCRPKKEVFPNFSGANTPFFLFYRYSNIRIKR